MTQLGNTTASEFYVLTICDSLHKLLNESERGSFALFDLFFEPTIKAGYRVFACGNFVSGGCAVDVGPLITERCASADIDKAVVSWTCVCMAIHYRDVLKFFRGGKSKSGPRGFHSSWSSFMPRDLRIELAQGC
jgi:hypothetical protein